MPVYGADVLSSGCFQTVGKLLAHSILHGGDGLVGLAPPIKEYMVSGSVELSRMSRNAPDKRKVQKSSFPRKYSHSFPINMQSP